MEVATLGNAPLAFKVEPGDEAGAWEKIQNNCPTLSGWGVGILRKGLDGFVKTVVLEKHYTCKDHRNLYSNFYSKKFLETSCYCSRLHFFDHETVTAAILLTKPSLFNDHYLGYSVIRPVKERCLGRTCISPRKIERYDGQTTHCLTTQFKAHLSGHEFFAQGFPYISQDAHANVCAHAALWSVCRYLSARYTVYKEVYPYDIIGLTGHNQGRTYPYRGMTFSDYCEILSAVGCHPVLLRLKRAPADPHNAERFWDMCSYVESGFPVLASLMGHVIVLIGHRIDYTRNYNDSQFEKDGYVDASAFWNQFIVSDDNAFPYARFGYNGDEDNYTQGAVIEDIATAVAPLPEKAFLPADRARRKAMAYMRKSEIKSELEVFKADSDDPLVCRLLLTTSTAFRSRKANSFLSNDGAPDPIDVLVANFKMPHFIWILQAAPLSLYKQGKCVAEIVLDSTAGHSENGLLYLRTGQIIRTSDKEKQIYEAREIFPIYRHNLGEDVI